MNGIEIATDHGLAHNDNDPGETPERVTAPVGENPESFNLVSLSSETVAIHGTSPYQQIPETANLDAVKQEFLN